MASIEVIKAVAVTAELCGRVFSEAAAAVFVSDLEGFPEQAVIKALSRCRKEVKGVLTVSDVVTRMDDGRPGPEEAWAMMPLDERQSVVWTDEMAEAFAVALPMVEQGDKVAARMAFKEAYVKALARARDERKPVSWHPSLGWAVEGRDGALLDAVSKGRMSIEQAREHVPGLGLPSDNRVIEMARTALRLPGVDMRGVV